MKIFISSFILICSYPEYLDVALAQTVSGESLSLTFLLRISVFTCKLIVDVTSKQIKQTFFCSHHFDK